MKKTTINRVLLLLTACVVIALSCFIVTSLPKPAVAAQEKAVAYSDYSLSNTPAEGVSITKDADILAAQGVTESSFVAWNPNAGKAKNWVNSVNRMTASVFTFKEAVDTSAYDKLVLQLDQTTTSAAIKFEFRFYRNEAGVVVGETEYSDSFTTTAIAANGKTTIEVNLTPFADENGLVKSFILLRYSDSRAQGNYPINFALYDGYLVPTNGLESRVDFNLSSTPIKATSLESIKYPSGNNLGYALNPNKVYVNSFMRSNATVINFTDPIDTSVYYSVELDISKNIGAATTYDFYPDLAGVVVGDADYSALTYLFTHTTNSRGIISLRLKDFADENGLVSSIIVVHTTDTRAEGDYEAFSTSFYTMELVKKADANVDPVLEINGLDMQNGTSNAVNNETFYVVSGNKMYANGVAKGYAVTIKFGNAIDTELFKTLLLNIQIAGASNKYTYYIDLYKAGATDFSHASATARYSLHNSPNGSFTGTMVIYLDDFANANGFVESITMVHYDNTGNDLQICNPQIFESYLDANKFTSYTIEKYGRGYAMPEKTEENKVFVGWDINGVLFAPFEIYSGETATAKPVYIEFYMKDGASIRVDQPAGLRYTAYVSKASDELLKGYVDVQYGTMFTSSNSISKLDVPQKGSWLTVGENYMFNGCMVNIDEKDYGRVFIGRSYVDITYISGETTRIFAVGSHIERTVKQVAQDAINAGEGASDANILDLLNKLAGNV